MSSFTEPPPPPPPPDPPAARDPGDGYRRLGPIIFVPEFRTTTGDPWAHRKGEPRVFALFWALYLMASAMLTIFAARALTPPAMEQYRYGCRAMVLMILLGALVLWPATRLSQAPPRRPARAALADLFVLLAPAQLVIWPMPLLTGWDASVVGGLALLAASWTFLIGAGVAHGSGSPSMLTRSMVMLLAIGAIVFAPMLSIALLGAGLGPAPRWLTLLSPFTASWSITAAPGHRGVGPGGGEWWLLAAPALLGLALWAGVLLRGVADACEEARPA